MRNQPRIWWKTGKFAPALPLFALLILIVILALFYRHGRDNASIRADPYALNTHTEIIGVALGVLITVYIIDARNRHHDERRRKQELKDRLLREARSPHVNIAQEAFYEMWASKLVLGEGSILRGANLHRARPGKVTLSNANMEKAFMWSADFSGSTLTGVVLDDADLMGAELDNVSLRDASLRNANLEHASLTHANLMFADLTGANLLEANLEHVQYFLHWLGDTVEDGTNPILPYQLILPDGCEATEDTDFSRFTDPDCPDFWRSPDPESPAYLGHYQRRLDTIRRFTEYRPPPTPPPPASSDPT